MIALSSPKVEKRRVGRKGDRSKNVVHEEEGGVQV